VEEVKARPKTVVGALEVTVQLFQVQDVMLDLFQLQQGAFLYKLEALIHLQFFQQLLLQQEAQELLFLLVALVDQVVAEREFQDLEELADQVTLPL
jgi:hypothetical protein